MPGMDSRLRGNDGGAGLRQAPEERGEPGQRRPGPASLRRARTGGPRDPERNRSHSGLDAHVQAPVGERRGNQVCIGNPLAPALVRPDVDDKQADTIISASTPRSDVSGSGAPAREAFAHLVRGLRTSFRASPRRFHASTISHDATPGASSIQGQLRRMLRFTPPSNSIRPRLGLGG